MCKKGREGKGEECRDIWERRSLEDGKLKRERGEVNGRFVWQLWKKKEVSQQEKREKEYFKMSQ